jgi:hypothetical protein
MALATLMSNAATRLRLMAMGPRTAAETMIAVDTFISEHRDEAVDACEAQQAVAPPQKARFLRLVCAELARLHRRGITAAQSLARRKNVDISSRSANDR